MIELTHVSKHFEEIVAVNDVSVKIKEGCVFGMIGTNGAGKSTIMRMITGVLKPDGGEILIDGKEVYDNVESKKLFFFIPDEPYFFSNATLRDMEHYYSSIYDNFNRDKFYQYLEHFELDKKRKINTFSKGMKKQAALLLGICAGTKYLFCDETFDGLDPVMRQGVKSIFANEMEERGLTPIIASHNLRELEDICDHVGIMDKGAMLLERSLADMQGSTVKVQLVGDVPEGLNVLHESQSGRLRTLVVRGSAKEVGERVEAMNPAYFDVLPLSLEEIFIYELGGVDYAIKEIVL